MVFEVLFWYGVNGIQNIFNDWLVNNNFKSFFKIMCFIKYYNIKLIIYPIFVILSWYCLYAFFKGLCKKLKSGQDVPKTR